MTQEALKTALPNIHSLNPEQRAAHYREEFSGTSRLQKLVGRDYKEFSIDTFAPAFRAEIIRILNDKGFVSVMEPLERLHGRIAQEMKDYNYDDGVNKITTYLYDTDDTFAALYFAFIRECVAKHFPFPFYFQATPTIRLHCPGGANANHYPRYHTDIGYGHPPQEINIWLPLTVPEGEQRHGFRRMSVADSQRTLEPFGYDFAPFIDKAINDKAFNRALDSHAPQVETPFGSMIAFDSRCIHTGEPLLAHTRASMDIRILPVEDFDALPVEYQGTGRRRIPYVPGKGYYHTASDRI